MFSVFMTDTDKAKNGLWKPVWGAFPSEGLEEGKIKNETLKLEQEIGSNWEWISHGENFF